MRVLALSPFRMQHRNTYHQPQIFDLLIFLEIFCVWASPASRYVYRRDSSALIDPTPTPPMSLT